MSQDGKNMSQDDIEAAIVKALDSHLKEDSTCSTSYLIQRINRLTVRVEALERSLSKARIAYRELKYAAHY